MVGTTSPVNVLGIPGSLRQAFYNKAALKAAPELLPEGATLEISVLGGVPPFNEDDERVPTRLAIKRCKSALIVRSPMGTA